MDRRWGELREYGTYIENESARIPYKTYPLRRFVNVTVKNTGRNLATNCEATARLLSKTEGCMWLSDGDKTLCWDDGQTGKALGTGRKAVFHLAFSQGNLTQTQEKQIGSVHCGFLDKDSKVDSWIATKRALESPEYGDADGLCCGEFKMHIEVSSEYGHRVRRDFIIKVGDGWRNLDAEEQTCHCFPISRWRRFINFLFHRGAKP